MEDCSKAKGTDNEKKFCPQQLLDELQDVAAFHALLARFQGANRSGVSFSALMVVLHNLVSDSIDPEWSNDRARLVCVRTAFKSLRKSMVGDVGPASGMEVPNEFTNSKLLGLGAHRSLDCSSGW